MSRFTELDTSTLLDILADQTRRLTELFTKKNQGQEYENCKQAIQELQSEIQRRKESTQYRKGSDIGGAKTTSN